jgi:hypothetical protein
MVKALVSIPIGKGIEQGPGDVIGGVKTATFEGEQLELLSPGFGQVQLADILGQEQNPDLRLGRNAVLTLRER